MRSIDSFKIARRMFAAAAILIFGSVMYACGGGSSSIAAGDLSPAQFNTDLLASPAFKVLKSQLADDEATIKAQGKLLAGLPIGHAPGTSVTSMSSDSGRTSAISLPGELTAAVVDFGPCPTMGDYIGSAAPDPSGATVDFFKQCTGITYGVNTGVTNSDGTHPVAKAAILWFVNANCDPSGGMISFADDGQYNDRTLLGGVVFFSPVDGTTLLQVAPTQAGGAPSNMTALSNFGAGTCNNGSETHKGFPVIQNTTSTGVPPAVNPYIL